MKRQWKALGLLGSHSTMKNIDPAYAEQLVTSQMGTNISESKQAGIPTIQQRIAIDESVHLPR